ncbi:MAG: histone deacetylase [Akkermansiaceae bacterium]
MSMITAIVALLSACGTAEPLATQKSNVPVVFSKKYKISLMGLEKLHPFDIAKYDKIYSKLQSEGWVSEKNSHKPDPLAHEQLKLIHTEEYINSWKKSRNLARYLEAPQMAAIPGILLQSSVVKRFQLASGGTLLAARLALKSGVAVNLGGGYHHAKPNTGEGFCLIADVPIAIRQLQKEKKIRRALIIDTDAHQGNGTIVCLPNDPTTFTFSIHETGIYPMPKEKGDWDIELKAGVTDASFLSTMKKALPVMFSRARPDIVFHVAGCDTLKGDPLANLQMTHDGIAKRDAMIAAYCKQKKIPYVMTMAGGYSKNAWKAQYGGILEVIKVYGKK